MRREAKQQSYIDWLKSMGCIVYMPLHDDKQDKISGLTLTETGAGIMQYDANLQMYLVKSASNYGTTNNPAYYTAVLDNGLNGNMFPSGQYTYLCKAKKSDLSTMHRMFGIMGKTYAYNTLFSAMYNGTTGYSSWPSDSFCFAYVDLGNSQNRNYYTNGVLMSTYSDYSPFNPSNWGNYLIRDGLMLGYAVNNMSANQYGYVSDFYLFNTALDVSTIRKIQGFE